MPLTPTIHKFSAFANLFVNKTLYTRTYYTAVTALSIIGHGSSPFKHLFLALCHAVTPNFPSSHNNNNNIILVYVILVHAAVSIILAFSPRWRDCHGVCGTRFTSVDNPSTNNKVYARVRHTKDFCKRQPRYIIA